MEQTLPFAEVVDAADRLSLDEQQTLLDILQHRIAERRRKALAQEMQEARKEFADGQSAPTSADDLMKKILS